MAGIRIKNLFFLCLLTFLLATVLTPSMGLAVPPKGEVVYATSAPNFYQVGGDSATHVSTVIPFGEDHFRSLDYVDQRGDTIITRFWLNHGKSPRTGKTIDFFLRDDVKFHNGDKFTAEDVKFSMETYLRKDLKYLFIPFWSRNIVKIEVLGPYQVRMHLNGPDPGFLGRLWWSTGMMPKKYREKVGDKGFAEKPVGTGPFKWVEYKQDVLLEGGGG